MLTAKCSGCGKSYQAPEKFAGKKMRCKQCSGIVVVPAAGDPAPPAEATSGSGSRDKQLEETAVLNPLEREELERTRARARRTYVKKKSTVRGARERTAGKRGAASRRRPTAPGGSDTAGGRKNSVFLLGGLLLVAVAAAGAGWYFFWRDADGDGSRGTRGTAATKASAGDDAITEAERSEPPLPARLDPLSLIPGSVGGLAVVDLERLFAAWNALPDEDREMAAASTAMVPVPEDMRGDLGRAVKVLEAAGIDYRKDLKRLHIAFEVPSAAPPAGEAGGNDAGEAGAETADDPGDAPPEVPAFEGLVILEGVFDRDRCLAALHDEDLLEEGTVEEGDLEGHAIKAEDGEQDAYLAFVSRSQIVLASRSFLTHAASLLAGDGEPIDTGGDLGAAAGDGSKPAIVRLAVALAETVPVPVPMPGLPPLKVDGFFVALDAPAGGLALDVALHCPSAEDATMFQQLAQGLLQMVAMNSETPPAIKNLLPKIVREVKESSFHVSLALDKADVDALRAAAPALIQPSGGVAPPPAEDSENE